jgi:tagaturonate reductase
MSTLPETVLQFGTGKFLRGFADLFIEQANREGQAVGQVVVVQSTGDNRANLFSQQGGQYHVLIRGLAQGQIVDRVEEVASVSRALSAAQQWPEVLAVARSPHLRILICNTAEVGYTLDPNDTPNMRPPRSWPAKLLLLLKERFNAGLPGLLILPCELFEHNGNVLSQLVLQLARTWELSPELCSWIQTACDWRNTLVDRIVAGKPLNHPHFDSDALLTVAEPFAFWAIQAQPGDQKPFVHPAITRAVDIQPFFLRKVRILNAAHTALLSQAVPRRFTTVREAVLDPQIGAWLQRLLFEEIVPVVKGRVEAPVAFAEQVLERFKNPFLEHKLSDIATYHANKVAIRLIPTQAEFMAKFGRRPALLDEAIAWNING